MTMPRIKTDCPDHRMAHAGPDGASEIRQHIQEHADE